MIKEGKITTLYEDASKTKALYPKTLTSAITNEKGESLDHLLENAGGGGGSLVRKTITKTLATNVDWLDTGITGADLDTGVYMVTINNNNHASSSIFNETWSGTLYWYSRPTNSRDATEIILSSGGHAPNGAKLYLQTIRDIASETGHFKLQICSNKPITSSTFIFNFYKIGE